MRLPHKVRLSNRTRSRDRTLDLSGRLPYRTKEFVNHFKGSYLAPQRRNPDNRKGCAIRLPYFYWRAIARSQGFYFHVVISSIFILASK
ncbi:hypothetical protein OGM63_25680 [Plectonema radiosum NIES-515]|uniref:Uncharacterized protein n=1 Tax=Plectonema radiosum NIES-515 TaxID=2986073 RepID=A0ABT3B658_9CYAN|nr:hypothetical protein [Plectonema radiosum]MCV3216856.1 hypothetical protein [Plectonema radiosum NIES-515]